MIKYYWDNINPVKGVQALDDHYTCGERNRLLTLEEINMFVSRVSLI